MLMTKEDWSYVINSLVIKDKTINNDTKDTKEASTPSYNSFSKVDYMLFCEQVLDPSDIRNYMSSKEKKQPIVTKVQNSNSVSNGDGVLNTFENGIEGNNI